MAWYRTGTISVTNGSAAVTGSGTSWLLNASAGEAMLMPDGKLYEIRSINSNTSITLATNYTGSTQSGQTYVVVPTQSYIRDLAAQAATLVNTYSTLANNAGAGKFSDGTAAAPGVTFVNDQDTGFFRSANNEVTFVANGVAQFKYSATGGITFLNNTVTINGTALVKTDDSRLTNSREWTAATVDQAEAEAGTGTTRRAWTAQRVRQAIAAWWAGITNIDGKNIGATTAGTGRFTTLTTTGNTTLGDSPSDTVTVSGSMGVGGAPVGVTGRVALTGLTTGGVNTRGFRNQETIAADVTASWHGYTSLPFTQAATFTLNEASHINISNLSKGAGSTVVDQHGIRVTDLTAGTNNYGITSQVSAGANKRNLNITGTADNVLMGSTGIGTATIQDRLSVNGNITLGFNSTSPMLRQSTADGADDARIQLCGGGAAGSSRGGYINLHGNEHALHPGMCDLLAGDVASGGSVRIYTSNAVLRTEFTRTGVVRPGADNTQSLGEASFRWGTVFAGTGTINTSDAREKTAVAEFSADELNAAKQLSKEIGIYQFLDSVAAKGESARKHIGLTVQRAIEIMEANNLNPFAYGFICHDEWDQQVIEHAAVEAVEAQDAWVETIEHEAELDEEGNTVVEAWTETIEHPAIEAVEAKEAWTEVTREAGDRFGFRYDQLNMFIARGIEARLAALEAA